MAIAVAGDHVVYARSSANTVKIGLPYTVFRTDTFRIPLSGAQLAGRPIGGVILRTSAGPTTGGLLVASDEGNHILAATGKNFRPQVTWCCTSLGHDTPVQTDGRKDAPMTLAVGLLGHRTYTLVRDRVGYIRLIEQDVTANSHQPLGPRRDTVVDMAPIAKFTRIVGDRIIWVDTRDYRIHVATITTNGTLEHVTSLPNPGPGPLVRLAASPTTIAVITRDIAPGRFQVHRVDIATGDGGLIWQGGSAGHIAVGDRTVAFAAGRYLYQHTMEGGTIRRAVLRSSAYDLATDGQRIGVIERLSIRRKPTKAGKRRAPLRQTAVRIVAVAPPPTAVAMEARR